METNNYFESYENLEVHKLMLEDNPRNAAYRKAIFDNQNEFKGKIVLDIGAGTGILSVLCAQAGAKTVYAVEASNTSKIAEEIVKENKFESIIKVINSKVEDLKLEEKVDIIISEWMGFYLLHEAMLDSVIFARKHFLKSGGCIFPENATLFAAPCSVPSMYSYWDNVEGVSMQYLGKKLREKASEKPICEAVDAQNLLSDPEVVVWIDLMEVELEDIENIEIQHLAVAKRNGTYEGICLYFCCSFPSTIREPVTLSTGPEDSLTHWKQTIIVLPTSIQVEESSPIVYDLLLKKCNEDNRRYKIEVTMLDPNQIEHPEYCMCHFTKCILARAVLENYERGDMET